jgi:hypothetical protein
MPRDIVTVFSKTDIAAPSGRRPVIVSFEGEFNFAGVYQAQPKETLRQLVVRAGGLTERAYVFGAHFMRESTRREQEERLRTALDRLEQDLQRAAVTRSQNVVTPDDAATVKQEIEAQRGLDSPHHAGEIPAGLRCVKEGQVRCGDPDSPPLKAGALERLLRDFMAVNMANIRLAQRYDAAFLNYLIDSERYNTQWDKSQIEQWATALCARLNQDSPDSVRFEIEVEKGEEGFDLNLSKFTHGVTRSKRIRQDFFLGPEYRMIGRLADTLFGLVHWRQGGSR